MAKFKVGDVVERIDEDWRDVVQGERYVVADCGKQLLQLKGSKLHYNVNAFKLVEKEMTNEQRLAELKASIALAQQQADELEAAMKKRE